MIEGVCNFADMWVEERFDEAEIEAMHQMLDHKALMHATNEIDAQDAKPKK